MILLLQNIFYFRTNLQFFSLTHFVSSPNKYRTSYIIYSFILLFYTLHLTLYICFYTLSIHDKFICNLMILVSYECHIHIINLQNTMLNFVDDLVWMCFGQFMELIDWVFLFVMSLFVRILFITLSFDNLKVLIDFLFWIIF